MPQQALIRKVEAFQPLSDHEREELVSLCATVERFARDQDIVSQGERPTHVKVMLEGWGARYAVNEDGGRRITALMLPGDFCDIHVTALAAMDHGIVALTECRVGLIRKEAIDRITRSTPALTLAFWRSTLVDEAILRQWLVNSGRKAARRGIAHLFCELHARLLLVGLADDNRMVVPLTQQDIGDAVGLTTVHVNRMLRELREQGLITLVRSALHIPDVAALRRQAGFDPAYLHLRAPDRSG